MTEIARFELLRDERIAEINTRARLYRHAHRGGAASPIENEDETKSSGHFRTAGRFHRMPHIMDIRSCAVAQYPSKSHLSS